MSILPTPSLLTKNYEQSRQKMGKFLEKTQKNYCENQNFQTFEIVVNNFDKFDDDIILWKYCVLFPLLRGISDFMATSNKNPWTLPSISKDGRIGVKASKCTHRSYKGKVGHTCLGLFQFLFIPLEKDT